ncbi:MAG: response regulator [Bacteroidota bacterium]
MITFTLVVNVCLGLYLYFDYNTLFENKSKNLFVVAKVIGTNAEAPLLFNDSEAANDILNDLKVETDVTNACILDTNLRAIGSYNKVGETDFDFKRFSFKTNRVERTKNDLFIYYKIRKDNEWLGTVCLKADLSATKEHFYYKVRIAALTLFIGLLMALLVSSILQRYISKPIVDLAELMKSVVSSMNYKVRSIYRSKDEIGQLSIAFNNMLEKIEKHEQTLYETNNQLESRVQERTNELKLQNEKLLDAKAIAEQSKKVKEQFLATMSHEIRTPLNAILGFQELLKETKLDGEQMDYVESIDFAGKNLLVIINDILDLSKIEAGKFDLNESFFNVNQALNSVKELIEFNAKEKDIELILNHDPAIPASVFGDNARFNQILLNLVGNAVKFTEHGFVTISSKLISAKADMVLCEFSVQDTGIGIAKDKLGIIFERFTQATPDTTRKYGGTGLGLTIVDQLLKLMGGKISVDSIEGEGSTFTFYLSFKQDNTSSTAIPKADKSLLQKKEESKKLNILVAEDTFLNQKLIRKIAYKWGHDLEIAGNGKEAILMLEKNNYDVILMDIQMPEMDGYAATKAIRKLEDKIKSRIPIIALTAHASQEEAQKCLDIGMNAYVSKPFDSRVLLDKIIQLTSNSSQIMQDTTHINKDIEPSSLPYDLSYVIEHADGDTGFIIEMISIFLNDTPGALEQLKADIGEKDYEKIKITSHSMKGLFLTLGVNEAARLLKEIETLAKSNGSLENINSNFKKIEDLFLQSKGLLEDELGKLKNE